MCGACSRQEYECIVQAEREKMTMPDALSFSSPPQAHRFFRMKKQKPTHMLHAVLLGAFAATFLRTMRYYQQAFGAKTLHGSVPSGCVSLHWPQSTLHW